jgi:hypothetical protein
MNYLYLIIGMITWCVVAAFIGLNLAKMMKDDSNG